MIKQREYRLVAKSYATALFNAANLVFITFANYYQNLDGQVFIIFVMVTAAAEVAVGLALIVDIFRSKKTISIDEMHSLKG